MKQLRSKNHSVSDNKLFVRIIVLSSLSIIACSHLPTSETKPVAIKLTPVDQDHFGDFDKVHVPNKPPVIAKMISVLKPDIDSEERNEVAGKIHQAFHKYKIEPQIVVAIIDTESSFNPDAVSTSGDLSIAQVNVDVWNKEFLRMNLDLIETEKLKADQAYSLEVMAQILNILKTRYGKKDRRWYARYHSKTKKHKRDYLTKLESRMKLLEKAAIVAQN